MRRWGGWMIDDTEYRVALGPVQQGKIPPGDPYWHEFNGSFVNRQLTQINIAAALYEGCPITTWHRNRWRCSQNYELGQHVGVDFDTEDQRSSLATLLKESFVSRYASILYTTPSHTPEKPRARVIFLLDTPIHQAKNYALAAASLLWLFSTADRQCKDPARFFYGGRPGACDMEWLPNELPLDMVKDLIRRYQATGEQAKRHVGRPGYEPQTPDETDIVDALKAIPPWGIDYDQWLAVLMSIHAARPDGSGLAIAESWAQGKDGEVAQKWRSFKPAGNTTGKVGPGTLFALAKDHGWTRH